MHQLSATLNSILEDTDTVPGVVAAVANAEGLLYSGAVGLRDTGSGVAMDIETIVAIASMTKPITTTAVLQLVDQGLVVLDAPASDYLPHLDGLQVLEGFDDDDKMVLTSPRLPPTVRQLLSHTSGYVYEIWNENAAKAVATDQVASLFDGSGDGLLAPLGFEPGSRWEYGIGIDLAGQIVESVAGKSLDVYFQDHIFSPLGMQDTFYQVPDEKLDRMASVHVRIDGGFEPAPPLVMPVSGGGGLHSTVHDYVRFMRMILNGGVLEGAEILKSATVDMMFENQIGALFVLPGSSLVPEFSNNFDMGFGVDAKCGLGFLLHDQPTEAGRGVGSGSWGGIFNSYFWIDRENDICAVLATQILPFFDDAVIALLQRFEAGVYATVT